MNVFELAIQLEIEMRRYYLELAQQSDNKGLHLVLMMLADDELKHYYLIKQIRENNFPKLIETKIPENVRNGFEELKTTQEEIELNVHQKNLYRKTQELERESERFYLEKVMELNNSAQKAILLKIATEEQGHSFLLEQLIEFFSVGRTGRRMADFIV